MALALVAGLLSTQVVSRHINSSYSDPHSFSPLPPMLLCQLQLFRSTVQLSARLTSPPGVFRNHALIPGYIFFSLIIFSSPPHSQITQNHTASDIVHCPAYCHPALLTISVLPSRTLSPCTSMLDAAGTKSPFGRISSASSTTLSSSMVLFRSIVAVLLHNIT